MDVAGITGAAGGKMVVPLLVAATLGLASAIGGVYEVGKAVENKRYWDTYYRNTHRLPRYGYRTGYYNYGNYARAAQKFAWSGYWLR